MFVEPYRTERNLTPAFGQGIGAIVSALLANSPNRQQAREAQAEQDRAQAELAKAQAQKVAIETAKLSSAYDEDLGTRNAQRRVLLAMDRLQREGQGPAQAFDAALGEETAAGAPINPETVARWRLGMNRVLNIDEAGQRSDFVALQAPQGRVPNVNDVFTRAAQIADQERRNEVELQRARISRPAPPREPAPTIGQEQGAAFRAIYATRIQAGDTPEVAAATANRALGLGGGGGSAATAVNRDASKLITDIEGIIPGVEGALDIEQLMQLPAASRPITGALAGLREGALNIASTALSGVGGPRLAPETMANTAKLRNAAFTAALLVTEYLKPASNSDLALAARAVGDGSATQEQLRALSSGALAVVRGRIAQERDALEAAVEDPRMSPQNRARATAAVSRLNALEKRINAGTVSPVGAPTPLSGETQAPAPGTRRGAPVFNPATGEIE